MGLQEILMAQVDRNFSTSCQQEIERAMGSGYGIGMEVGRKLTCVLKAGGLEGLRPPIFATEPDQDVGESAGFKAQLGAAPDSSWKDVAHVIRDRFGLETIFVNVVNEEDLIPAEKAFMSGRLPAVRVCPVATYFTEAAVA